MLPLAPISTAFVHVSLAGDTTMQGPTLLRPGKGVTWAAMYARPLGENGIVTSMSARPRPPVPVGVTVTWVLSLDRDRTVGSMS